MSQQEIMNVSLVEVQKLKYSKPTLRASMCEAQHSTLASHPAALGLILCVPKNFSLDAAEIIDATA